MCFCVILYGACACAFACMRKHFNLFINTALSCCRHDTGKRAFDRWFKEAQVDKKRVNWSLIPWVKRREAEWEDVWVRATFSKEGCIKWVYFVFGTRLVKTNLHAIQSKQWLHPFLVHQRLALSVTLLHGLVLIISVVLIISSSYSMSMIYHDFYFINLNS